MKIYTMLALLILSTVADAQTDTTTWIGPCLRDECNIDILTDMKTCKELKNMIVRDFKFCHNIDKLSPAFAVLQTDNCHSQIPQNALNASAPKIIKKNSLQTANSSNGIPKFSKNDIIAIMPKNTECIPSTPQKQQTCYSKNEYIVTDCAEVEMGDTMLATIAWCARKIKP